jgi:hypothetical protein
MTRGLNITIPIHEHFHVIAQLDLQLEIQGHVVLDGRCIRSRSLWLSAAN